MDADPFFADELDIDAARALVAATPRAELFLYPGNQHLFVDHRLPSYDEQAHAADGPSAQLPRPPLAPACCWSASRRSPPA